jgi:hypothetical protein
MVVAPSKNVVKGGILIESATNLGRGSSEILAKRKLSQNWRLPIVTTSVVGTP